MKLRERKKVKPKPAAKTPVIEQDEELCTQCKTNFSEEGAEAVGCEMCDEWICITCIKMPAQVYKFLEANGEAFPYICKDCTPKLVEMKDMMELRKNHADLQLKVEGMEQKQKEDRDLLTAIQLQMSDLQKANEDHTKAVTDINTTLSEIKANNVNVDQQFPELLATNPPQSILQFISNHVQPTIKANINTEISERDQIELIKHNLIISGMEAHENPQEDLVAAVQLIKDEMDIIAEVESVQRIDRKTDSDNPKLLRVVFKSMKTRKAILSKATTLRQSATDHVKNKIFIRPELTKKQMEESKNLTTELRAKKAANPTKKFKIYRGEIIEVNMPTLPIPAVPPPIQA